MVDSMAPAAGHQAHVLRYWALELVTVVVAALLTGAIIGLLAWYDGKFMPEWPLAINLNSAIAVLSTFLRAAILAAVAEIIGQIKWTWFTERTRPLHHLQDFDSASRSVLGSLRLLAVVAWNWSFTSAGLLGMCAALVTIASLAVGPVTQQAIKTVTCPQLLTTAQAALPVAHYVPGSSGYYRVGAGLYEVEVDMKSAMIQGLTDPGGQDSDVAVVCSTGNCSWPDHGTGVTHASIGLCSACLDTTGWVSAPNAGGNLTLPDDGAFINYTPGGAYMWVGASNLSAYASLWSEDFATAAAVSVSNVSVLLTSTAPCTGPDPTTGRYACPHRVAQANSSAFYDGIGDYVAAACILYPCVKHYAASYADNVLRETVVHTAPAVPNTQETTDYTFYYNYTAGISPCVLDDNGTWYDYTNQSAAPRVPGRTWANLTVSSAFHDDDARNSSVPNACLFKMDGFFFSALSRFLTSTLFSARCAYDAAQSGQLDCGDAWWLAPLWRDMNATFSSVDDALADFARVVTNKFRMTGAGPDLRLGEPVTHEAVRGAVYETSTCIRFDRRWIALPVLLVLICALLLAWIMSKSYRDPEQPVWKGSILPLLFFGLHAPGATAGTTRMRSASEATSLSSSSGSSNRGRGRSSSGGGGGGASTTVPPGGTTTSRNLAVYEKERMTRAASFMRENGRAAPELDRIQNEAGKLWVRFHGGTEPGFVDLGSHRSVARRADRAGRDAEASIESLVPGGGPHGTARLGNRDSSLWPEFKMSSRPFRRSAATTKKTTTTTAAAAAGRRRSTSSS